MREKSLWVQSHVRILVVQHCHILAQYPKTHNLTATGMYHSFFASQAVILPTNFKAPKQPSKVQPKQKNKPNV